MVGPVETIEVLQDRFQTHLCRVYLIKDDAEMFCKGHENASSVLMFTVPLHDLQTGVRCASLLKRRLALSGITVFTPATNTLTPRPSKSLESH